MRNYYWCICEGKDDIHTKLVVMQTDLDSMENSIEISLIKFNIYVIVCIYNLK